MKIEIRTGEGYQQVVVDGMHTDLGVNTRTGYQLYKRTDGLSVPLADKVSHLLGKRVVMAPKHDGQITEADLLEEIAKRAPKEGCPAG